MKVTKIREDVWKFKGVGSVYLIKNGNKWILIDSGDFEDREFLKDEISRVVALDKIDIVLLTHLHRDHSAGLDLFPNARIYVSKEEFEDYLKDAKRFHFFSSDEVDRILKEKAEFLPEEIEGIKVLKVPGHTRGSVAFLDDIRKILFSGDSIFGGDIIGRSDFANSLPEEMEKSVEMLRSLVVNGGLSLCPGHGYWQDKY